MTVCDAPAAIDPLVKFDENAPLMPVGSVSELTVSVVVPVFVMVNDCVALCPTTTLPNASVLVLSAITRVPDDPPDEDDGDVGELPLPPPQAIWITTTARNANLKKCLRARIKAGS